MADSPAIRRLHRADKALASLEGEAIARLQRGLRRAEADLLAELKGLPAADLTDSQRARQLRARSVLSQLQVPIRALRDATATVPVRDLVLSSSRVGIEAAADLVAIVGGSRGAGRHYTVFPAEALAAQAERGTAALARHGEAYANRASDVITAGIVKGSSVGAMARELAVETGRARYDAERVVRTETLAAFDHGAEVQYRDLGVEYVQWTAALEFGAGARVCPYCAARHGHVWRLEEAPTVPAHPMCRCARMPWDPEWARAGLTSAGDFEKDAARFEAHPPEGHLAHGATPFEKSGGFTMAAPVWKPGDPPPARDSSLEPGPVAAALTRAPGANRARLVEALGGEDQVRAIVDLEREVERLGSVANEWARKHDAIEGKIKRARTMDSLNRHRATRDEISREWTRAYDEWRTRGAARDVLVADARRLALDALAAPTPAAFTAKGLHLAVDADQLRAWEGGIEAFKRLVGDGFAVQGLTVGFDRDPNQRSFYRQDTVYMARHKRERTVVHELGHWLEERDRGIFAKVDAFLVRRVRGEPLERLKDIHPTYNYRDDERTWRDHFLDAYMGKDYRAYGSRYASEIISMGLEYLYAEPWTLALEDPDMFDFMMNALGREDDPATP